MTSTSFTAGPRPIFGTGLSRSGGRLWNQLLSVHNDVTVATCPYMELFRSLRNAIVRANTDLGNGFDPGAPVDDYYFSSRKLEVLDAVLSANLDLPFDPAEWAQLREISETRAALESGELVPYLDDLNSSSYHGLFDNALGIIARARDAGERRWVGLHETWVLEFWPVLARAYPDARFLVMLRDPRAIVNSMLGVATTDPDQLVQVSSYARHWRKYVALSDAFARNPLFEGRLLVASHELVVSEPEAAARQLCDLLEVDFDPRMLDTDNYIDHSTGSVWSGNSSFESTTAGIKKSRALRWREQLDPVVMELVELLCAPEFGLVGLEPQTEVGRAGSPSAEVIDYVIAEEDAYTNWRTGTGDPQCDLGYELFRWALLRTGVDTEADDDLIRRSFLFRHVFDAIRSGATPLPVFPRLT